MCTDIAQSARALCVLPGSNLSTWTVQPPSHQWDEFKKKIEIHYREVLQKYICAHCTGVATYHMVVEM